MWTLLRKLYVQRDLKQGVIAVPLRQKNALGKAFSRAENEDPGLGDVHQYLLAALLSWRAHFGGSPLSFIDLHCIPEDQITIFAYP